MSKPDPLQPTIDAIRNLARHLLSAGRFAVLGVRDPADGKPLPRRIAIACDPVGAPISVIASSARITGHVASPSAALRVGEPGPKLAPLTHPRCMMQVVEQFIAPRSFLRCLRMAFETPFG